MKRLCLILRASLLMVALTAIHSHADWRGYVWTYEYMTVERGGAEFETYFTLSSPDIDSLQGNMTAEHQVELEIGMTERYDFAVYQMFEQVPGGKLEYKGYKLRSRYRLGEKDMYFLDPLIYFEYKGKPDFSEHEIELKLILAKDLGKTNISLNPVAEFEGDGDWEFKPEYAIAIGHKVSRLFRLGIEARGSESGHYIGPVISHGRDNLWMTLGSAIKVGDIDQGKPEFQIRLLMGIGLFE